MNGHPAPGTPFRNWIVAVVGFAAFVSFLPDVNRWITAGLVVAFGLSVHWAAAQGHVRRQVLFVDEEPIVQVGDIWGNFRVVEIRPIWRRRAQAPTFAVFGEPINRTRSTS